MALRSHGVMLIAIAVLIVFSVISLKSPLLSGELSAEILGETLVIDDLTLPPTHPDEPAEYTYTERFSPENALDNISQIQNALSSFQKLTIKAESILEQKELDEVGNTLWEIQYLAFPNWIGGVQGTIEKQNYLIKKLELELAQKQYHDGEVEQTILASKAADYELAKQNFLEFWTSFTMSD